MGFNQLLCVSLFVAMSAISTTAAELNSVQTPSRNIHCQFDSEMGGNIDCEIIEYQPSAGLPERPADCDLDYGSRFIMESAGEASMACYGDTVRNADAEIIPYGSSYTLYGITCISEKTGLTCTNEDAHGFRLSKGLQELF
jgi:hypothetical protein